MTAKGGRTVEQNQLGATLEPPVHPLLERVHTTMDQEIGAIGQIVPPTSVSVYLRAIQMIDGESDVTELFTQGTIYHKQDLTYLLYQEQEEDAVETLTTLKVEGQDKIWITRQGGTRSSLLVERGARHVGFYSTQEGNFTIGIAAAEIKQEWTQTGGMLYFKYAMDINAVFVSHHEVLIQITPE